MGHFKVTEFKGEAEVIGYIKPVGYSDGVLQISDLNISQARLVLEHLAAGGLRNDGDNMNAQMVHAPLDPPAAEAVETAAAVEASKPKLDELMEQGRANAKAEDAKAEAIEEPSKEAPVEAKTEAKADKPVKSKSKATSKKVQKKAPPDEPAKAEKSAANVVDLAEKREAGGIVEKVAKFTKLVDVIQVLREEGGLADDGELIAECERIKDQVPALQRITDVPGRVKRVLERLSA